MKYIQIIATALRLFPFHVLGLMTLVIVLTSSLMAIAPHHAAYPFGHSASTTLVIWYSKGGTLQKFWQAEIDGEAREEYVEVRGRCASACTVVLHNPHVCIAAGGSFMFHRAWEIAHDGEEATPNPEATAVVFSIYPEGVQEWITARGGLTDFPLIMTAQDAWLAGVERCR
jgi:hypothetical protein